MPGWRTAAAEERVKQLSKYRCVAWGRVLPTTTQLNRRCLRGAGQQRVIVPDHAAEVVRRMFLDRCRSRLMAITTRMRHCGADRLNRKQGQQSRQQQQNYYDKCARSGSNSSHLQRVQTLL